MLGSHFMALMPLLILLLFSLIFYGKGLVHIMTLGYDLSLSFIAAGNSWEILFFPILVTTGIIAIILFWYSMVRGNWV